MYCPTNALKAFGFFCQRRLLLFAFFTLNMLAAQSQSLFDSLYDIRVLEVRFETGKSELGPESKLVLDSVLHYFNRTPGEKTVRITAHTDAEGNPESNEALSLKRGKSVSKWLTSNGLPASSIISLTAFGERDPVSSNQTPEGRRRNRRATVEIARRVPMSWLEGQVTDKSTGKGLEATVTFFSKTRKDSSRTDPLGRYKVKLPKDSIVKIEVQEKNYFFESVTMKIFGSPELYKKYKLSPDIQLPPAKPGEMAVLRDLFFMGDQAILLKASEPELPKILKFMQLNPELQIEIAGHINQPYPEQHNFKLNPGQTPADYVMSNQEPFKQTLSERRALLVRDYLLEKGVSPERMTAKGYKNSRMLFPHAKNERDQEMNRRVEIMVTGRTGQ